MTGEGLLCAYERSWNIRMMDSSNVLMPRFVNLNHPPIFVCLCMIGLALFVGCWAGTVDWERMNVL